MRAFDATQTAIAAAVSKSVWWLFTVTFDGTTYRWATAARSWAGNTFSAKLLAGTFTGVTMHRCRNELGMLPQNETAFHLDNADGAITASDLINAALLVELLVSDGTDTAVMRTWAMTITQAVPLYGRIEIEAEDFLQQFTDGDFPPGLLAAELSPADAGASGWSDACLPVVVGTAYIPLSPAWVSSGFRYILGTATPTYTISAVHSPPDKGESEWLAAGYSFNQATYTLNSVDYRTFQPIIADSNFDGVADAPGFWRDGNRVAEIWTKFSTSATGTTTNPADVLEYVLGLMGLTSYLDTGGGSTFAVAATTYGGWGLAFAGGWTRKNDRGAVVCNLLDQAHAAIRLTDKLEVAVRVKASQATIANTVLAGTLRRSPILQSQPDACYVSWSESGKIMDNRNRATVPAKSSTANIATETLICHLVQDSVKAQKLGSLRAQRKFLRAEQLSFTELGYQLAVDPDDWITINNSLYGGNYPALVESIRFRADLLLDFTVLRLSAPADDWADLSPAAITVTGATTNNMWTAAAGGPDATVSSGGAIASVSNYAISNDNKRDAIAAASGVTVSTYKTYGNGSVDLKISWTWTGNEYDIDGFILYGYASASASPWVLTDAYYSGLNFLIGQDTVPQNLFFKPDGTKMYVVGSTNDKVFQYSLSTAWDVATAGYDSVFFAVGGQDTTPQGLFFKPDGTKMYVVGYVNKRVYQYSLSTAWDVGTASYDSVSFSVSGQDTVPQNLFFKPDGTKMYLVGYANDKVYQYSLSTAWGVGTASYDSVFFSVGSQEAEPQGLFFKPDGTKMYLVGEASDKVYQYSLSTAWDVGTASYDSVSFSVSSQDATPQNLFFKPDGTKMYLVGVASNKAYQYNISPSYTVGSSPASETSVLVPAVKREHIVQGVAADLYFTAGVQPFRNVNTNISAAGVIKSATIAQNAVPYQSASTTVFLGTVSPSESTYPDGTDIDFGTVTGSKVGAAANQKIAFWGATPIVQPSGASQATVTLGNTDNEIGALTFSAPAAFNNADNEIGGLTISATYTDTEIIALRDKAEELADDCRALRETTNTLAATEIIALRDKCEELADDVRNLSTLLHAIRTAMVAAGSMKGSA